MKNRFSMKGFFTKKEDFTLKNVSAWDRLTMALLMYVGFITTLFTLEKVLVKIITKIYFFIKDRKKRKEIVKNEDTGVYDVKEVKE